MSTVVTKPETTENKLTDEELFTIFEALKRNCPEQAKELLTKILFTQKYCEELEKNIFPTKNDLNN